MNFERIKQTMTKEEFLNNEDLTNYGGCPEDYGLKNKSDGSCLNKTSCRDCWAYAIENGNVKFKDDKSEEQKVIDALKVVKEYCKSKDGCVSCKSGGLNYCIIRKSLDGKIPMNFEINKIEEIFNPKEVVIYKVEHSKGGKQYTFVADEDLPIGTMVICDTKYGQTYGKIVDAFKSVDDGNKKCWRLE